MPGVDNKPGVDCGGPKLSMFSTWLRKHSWCCDVQQLELKRTLCAALQDVGVTVNSSKAAIDQVTQQLAAKAAAAPRPSAEGAGQVLDAEQYNLLQELKTSKAK
jgi:hypothetical protein